jgi:hypothetical protein
VKIDVLQKKLDEMKSLYGNIEVTMVGTLNHPDNKDPRSNTFESTVESLFYKNDEFAKEKNCKRVLVAWQT